MQPNDPSVPEPNIAPGDAIIERTNEGEPVGDLARPSSVLGSAPQDATVRHDTESSISASFSEHYQGVVAHPRHLAQFEQIVPGSAARMMDWAEDEANHRREMERLESDREFELERMRIEKDAEIQSQAIGAQATAVTSENQVRTQVGCGAHATAGVALVIGLILSLNARTTEAVAVFTALGAIYGGGIVAGALSGTLSKKKALPPKSDSSE